MKMQNVTFSPSITTHGQILLFIKRKGNNLLFFFFFITSTCFIVILSLDNVIIQISILELVLFCTPFGFHITIVQLY